MVKKLTPYINRFTGDVKIVNKSGAKKLGEEYGEVKFIKNEQGEPIMRFELEGATVDISESEAQVELEGTNGDGNTEEIHS